MQQILCADACNLKDKQQISQDEHRCEYQNKIRDGDIDTLNADRMLIVDGTREHHHLQGRKLWLLRCP